MAQPISIAVGFEFWIHPVKWSLWPAPNTDVWTRKDSGALLVPSLTQGRTRRADAWQARDEFFDLKLGDISGLLKFFNRWGQWHSDSLDDAVSVEEVWRIRERFLKAVMAPLSEWLTDQSVNVSPLALFRPRAEYPHFFSKTSWCAVGIHTTITLDLLRRVKFRLCARKDCRTPFAVESNHDRKYHSQYCGHLESLRKQRREAKKAKGRKHA